jgi:heme oxygenase
MHRRAVQERLLRHLPAYTKGQGGHWADTKEYLAQAMSRAAARAAATTAQDGHEPYTGMHLLVSRLLHLKD